MKSLKLLDSRDQIGRRKFPVSRDHVFEGFLSVMMSLK